MDISFWLTTPVDLSDGLDRPLGGAEVSAVQLATELAKTNTVYIYCNTAKKYTERNMVMFPYNEIQQHELDTLIVVRAHEILNTRIRAWFKKRPRILINWSGDAYDQPNNAIFGDKWLCDHMDGFVTKSKWQRETLNTMYPNLINKTKVIYNGVDDSLFPDAPTVDENKFIWASTWYRGLDQMPEIWKRIKTELPDAHLKVYAKTSLYMDGNQDIQAKALFAALESLDSVTVHDPVPQRELINELATAKLLLYPNAHFMESSCGVVQQSICAGTPVITSARAGLPETVSTEGFAISHNPGTEEYYTSFTEKVLKLCRDQKLYNRLSRQGLLRRTGESWNQVARKWTRYLESL